MCFKYPHEVCLVIRMHYRTVNDITRAISGNTFAKIKLFACIHVSTTLENFTRTQKSDNRAFMRCLIETRE